MRYLICIFILSISFNAVSSEGVEINNEFPWQLFVDRGKLIGCIYENKYYSEGSVIINEGLPRKCKIAPTRDSFWADLTDQEYKQYIAALEKRNEIEEKALKIGEAPVSKLEGNLIRLMRRYEKHGY